MIKFLILGTCLMAACSSPTAPSPLSSVPPRVLPVPLDSARYLP